MSAALPATLTADAIRTATPLRDPECRRLKQHSLIWYGIGLCCWPNTVNDQTDTRRRRP